MRLLGKLSYYITKIMIYLYPTYLILAIIAFPFIFLFGGFSGIKEAYIDTNDLSYRKWKEYKNYFWRNR